jgi:hypothetical protein
VGNVFIPNTYINITRFLETKLVAMQHFSTQLVEFPHPRSIQGIESLAKLRGSTIGVEAAEAFCLLRRIIF